MYKSEWTNEPVLHVLPHWNWEAGKTVDVWAYYRKAFWPFCRRRKKQERLSLQPLQRGWSLLLLLSQCSNRKLLQSYSFLQLYSCLPISKGKYIEGQKNKRALLYL
jgi:hypothetical protein